MSRPVYNSFSDLAEVFGIAPVAKKKKAKPFFCRKCGHPMIHVPSTNVYMCEHIDKDGKECGHLVFTARAF